MAKQNFLAGGYYGKLGQTVGQRWKNIRTIRSYVIPHNPRTEIQQKNRGRFGDCVFYAQLGNQLNFKAPCFKADSMTDWNYRMKTARELQDLGLEELERIPLYPTSLSVPYTISEATITEQITSTRVKISVSGNLPEKERVLTLVLLLPGQEDFKNRLAICIGSNTESDPNTFLFQLPETLQLVDGMQGRFISCDDEDSSSDLIASSQIPIAVQTKDIHTFDTTITAAERSGNNFTFTFAEPYNNGTNTVEVASLHCVVNGAWQDVTGLSGELINKDEQFALVLSCSATDNQDLWALPVGSKLNLTSISTNSATVEATAENTESDTSNSDLSRTYKNTVASISRSNQTFTVAFSRALPENATASGNVAVHAVKNGAFTDSTISAYTLAASSLSFSTTETRNQDVLAFPAGSTVTADLSLSCNGVTYTAETTAAQSATNSDLSRTYESTVLSISRSGQTFTIGLSSTLPSRSSSSGSVSVRAVKKGAWATSSFTNFSVSGANIAFTTSEAYEENILAFPSGSTVSIGAVIVGNGVTYSPATATAQSVANTSDLTRNITSNPDIKDVSGDYYLSWSISNIEDKDPVKIALTTKSNYNLWNSTQSLNWWSQLGGNEISLAFDEGYGLPLAVVGSYVVGNTTVGGNANGVRYQLAAQNYAFDSHGIECDILRVSGGSVGNTSLGLLVMKSSSDTTAPDLTAISAVTNWDSVILSDENDDEYSANDVSPDNVFVSGNYIELYFVPSWDSNIPESVEGTEGHILVEGLKATLTFGGQSYPVNLNCDDSISIN